MIKKLIGTMLIITMIYSCITDDYYYEYYDNSQVKLSGIIKNGEKEGQWTELYEDGAPKMEMNFVKGVKTGIIIIWYNNVEMGIGQVRARGNYVNDLKEGKHSFWYENGQLDDEGIFINGKEEAIWTSWFENGKKMKEVNYENGKKEGGFLIWYKNGKKHRDGSYKNNELDGKCEIWDEEGCLIKEEFWEQGELKETKEY